MQMAPTSNSPKKSFTALAELIANQAVAAAGTAHNSRSHNGNDNDDDDSLPKILRRDEPGPENYIAPFTRGAVGEKYVVIKGVKPGIYSDWYASSVFLLLPRPLTVLTGPRSSSRFIWCLEAKVEATTSPKMRGIATILPGKLVILRSYNARTVLRSHTRRGPSSHLTTHGRKQLMPSRFSVA
jgi:hypothetical protein